MSRTFVNILASLITSITNVQSRERACRNRLMLRDLLTQREVIETSKGTVNLICTSRSEVVYAHHFLDREPCTIEWIDSFRTPCIFWDVGANIGMYSVYAALADDIEVYAFEPMSGSYASLCNNIQANGLDERIIALCLGFFDKTMLTKFSLSSTEAGSVRHSIGPLKWFNDKVERTESILTFSIDDFWQNYGERPPNYIKIDVDSVEEAILKGMSKTLSYGSVVSVLIEKKKDDDGANVRIAEFFAKHGFNVSKEVNSGNDMIFSR